MTINMNPWDMGDNLSSTAIPSFVKAKYVCVKLIHPKLKTERDGLVGTFLMTSYEDEFGKKVELVEATEGPSGHEVKFPLGKKGLIATKYRGPQNQYRFINPETGKWFSIPKEKMTPEYAAEYLFVEKDANGDTRHDSAELSEDERETLITEYLQEMFLFGLSQDLVLPANSDGSFTKPFVGLTTTLYRVSTPPDEGSKYPNIKITKWERGKPSLTGEYDSISEEAALAIYAKQQERDDDQFDPTTFKETKDEAPF